MRIFGVRYSGYSGSDSNSPLPSVLTASQLEPANGKHPRQLLVSVCDHYRRLGGGPDPVEQAGGQPSCDLHQAGLSPPLRQQHALQQLAVLAVGDQRGGALTGFNHQYLGVDVPGVGRYCLGDVRLSTFQVLPGLTHCGRGQPLPLLHGPPPSPPRLRDRAAPGHAF